MGWKKESFRKSKTYIKLQLLLIFTLLADCGFLFLGQCSANPLLAIFVDNFAESQEEEDEGNQLEKHLSGG